MKAKFIAIALSLSVTTLSAYAALPKEASIKKKPPIVLHKIDLNTADISMLTGSIKGIGKKRAEAIIAYRKSHHGFKSLEELAEVKGLGQRFMAVNRDKLNQVFTLSKIE
ncbi:helix-hairpin-helix domain-containing protein [Fluoribacter dumoffii]|uniref:Competence protein ComEA helix-hairpin-helix repeat region n=1 Tax=Fluoribacter dumoffii TaxID=463 RepID=A0A377GC53_9GAMM|nr:helix-hairpin-helix domain-containing protein [Fluoribacter dumoffii]KTC88634.1 competence protein ComEA [Fluoribacter dumoffii NY 23]MCW8386074.1 helix-hairpin-helix domain-containing protein [Fluoribacter dumoffii]MCW8419126.1 helix-hairpin-helix domain-containing protein [Fluoribacter dumoffii]MCW8453030.1 helix-hairpin-helix domain-containing protein [Fluoribacter dumoffii]MCW8459752.1 helix-hairpin-helix domain-containing protein [Fluoribacter dumoffii]